LNLFRLANGLIHQCYDHLQFLVGDFKILEVLVGLLRAFENFLKYEKGGREGRTKEEEEK